MKERNCKYSECKKMFVKNPNKSIDYCCSSDCYYKHAMQLKEKKAGKEKAATKKELMTKSDWIKLTQQVFNKYIRLRDKDQPCISCDAPLIGKYDAGHYYSCGAYPGLRFEELNVHAQCVRCNQHLHSNSTVYSIKLPNRIGDYNFELLKDVRNVPKNYSIPELQELIKTYKQKIKDL